MRPAARVKAAELRTELHQADKKDKGYAKKKIALKKVVANMTMGNDSEWRVGKAGVAAKPAWDSVALFSRDGAMHANSGLGDQKE